MSADGVTSKLTDYNVRILGGFSIALRVLNPFRRPFDGIISSFNKRHDFLKAITDHADKREHHRDKEQKKLDDFMKSLNIVDPAPKHVLSQDTIRPDDNPGGWLLQRNEYKEWSTSYGLLWVNGKRECACDLTRLMAT